MGLYWSFFAQFLGKIIPPPHSHTPQVLVKHNSSSASFDRQIACMVHTFMQFVANHETLTKSLHRMKQSKAIMIRQN
nr:hypothetical protein K64PH164C4_LOCUS56 [Klebsiella phage vB_Kpn_K64PH164C4]